MTEHEHSPHEELDARTAKKLFFLSFKHSQGDQRLQASLFSYLHLKHPDWRITNEQRDALVNTLTRQAAGILSLDASTPTLHTHEYVRTLRDKEISYTIYPLDIRNTALQTINLFQGIINMPVFDTNISYTKSSIRVVVDSISAGIIERDYRYLVERGGRPRTTSEQTDHINAHRDPWLSHIMYYGFEAHTTGSEDFDQLYHDVTDYIQHFRRGAPHISQVIPEKFDAVKRVHEDKHL